MPAMTQATTHSTVPWYREPWPWLLMLGPAGAIIAGAFTVWLAVVHEDGLVADDYYKQGLAINKVIRRQSQAVQLGLQRPHPVRRGPGADSSAGRCATLGVPAARASDPRGPRPARAPGGGRGRLV